MTLNIVSSFNGVSDPDAAAYIEAVEAADGDLLEFAVGKAINDFVLGCKADGIWDAIKASCILAGARTLAGALQPLVGTAPNKFGTESNWNYNRKTGLQGDGSTNYLDSNKSLITLPSDNCSFGVYCTQAATANSEYLASNYNGGGLEFVKLGPLVTLNTFGFGSRRDSVYQSSSNTASATGFIGSSRSSLTSFQYRILSNNTTQLSDAQSPRDSKVFIFARNQVPVTLHTDARLAFYSIGESLDLAKLDARVTDLITAFGAAIP